MCPKGQNVLTPSFCILLIAATTQTGGLAHGLPADPGVIDILGIINSFDYDNFCV